MLAARPRRVVCLIATALSGVAGGCLNPIIGTVIVEQVPATMRARVMGGVAAGAWAAMPIGSLAAGLLVERLGLVVALLGLGAGYLLVTVAPLVGGVWAGLDRGDRTVMTDAVPGSTTVLG